MKKIIKNQAGFGIIETIIVVIVLGLIGFVGYYAYSQKHKTPVPTNQNTQATTDASTKTETTTSQAQATSGVGFYEIKEWGIKIALRDYDKVQFDIKNQNGQIFGGDPYDAYADPSFKAAALQDKTCDPGVALYRSKTKFASGRDDAQNKIGDYYYIVTGGPGACTNDSDNQLKTRFLYDVSQPNNITKL